MEENKEETKAENEESVSVSELSLLEKYRLKLKKIVEKRKFTKKKFAAFIVMLMALNFGIDIVFENLQLITSGSLAENVCWRAKRATSLASDPFFWEATPVGVHPLNEK